MTGGKQDWGARAKAVVSTNSDNFLELLTISGLDPKTDLRFADWSGVDFSGCDLRGFDFTAARLTGCKFDGALIDGARFEQAEIGEANLHAAKDWEAHRRNWVKARKPVPSDHLPVGAVFFDAPYAPEMVVVPAGSFLMGSPPDEGGRQDREGPQHEVTIAKRFAIGRFAVTFAEWDAAQADNDWRPVTGLAPRKPADSGWGRVDRPVIDVNWDDAKAYTAWLSYKTGKDYRLPGEAEWEYVCRAATATPFWWGKAITPNQANYDGRYPYAGGEKGENRGMALPVRSFDPNPWGLYQVHGNVWEWCEDYMRSYGSNPVSDPVGSLDNAERALRGGSWLFDARFARSANRFGYDRVGRNVSVGFRCARVLP